MKLDHKFLAVYIIPESNGKAYVYRFTKNMWATYSYRNNYTFKQAIYKILFRVSPNRFGCQPRRELIKEIIKGKHEKYLVAATKDYDWKKLYKKLLIGKDI